MRALEQLLDVLNVSANVFHNGRYCDAWSIDTSGTGTMAFHVVTEGRCCFSIGDQDVWLETGDSVFLPFDDSHRVSHAKEGVLLTANVSESLSMNSESSHGSTGLVCGNFGHENPLFNEFIRHLPVYIVVRGDDAGIAGEILALIVREARQSDRESSLMLNRLADALFYSLVRDHLTESTSYFSALVHPKVGQALRAVHDNLQEKYSVQQLAEIAGMSRTAFSQQFKELTGHSPNDYAIQWKLANAYNWLSKGDTTTLQAALAIGYESEAAFSKAFKKVYGFGPGKVRRA